ncbi:restriction endonuclease subunit S [Brachyspira hyodysenteriae]|uniref:restriction endonuclease subunit S n=1 Tax=Brachyspira hyodysenteriae TaxID=159 RepID=UPI0022CD9022|nr:restriction endonuclease subunit S [Brachyspira hyodysenteriae]MCZ9838971.1 restriction endonuclease subunit S [Brachyspira hyodysenteriae]MCZ9929292.1 restriction endonuclease subunit S [Brachyspira hyodysenteriae]
MINNWEEKTLDEVCIKISAGGDKPQSFSKNKTDKFNIPVYANGTELNGLQGYTDKATITENAITISARGTIGFICKRLEPYCPIVRLISLIPRDYIYLDFLYYALHLMIYNSSGSSIPQLTVPQLKRIK